MDLPFCSYYRRYVLLHPLTFTGIKFPAFITIYLKGVTTISVSQMIMTNAERTQMIHSFIVKTREESSWHETTRGI